MQIPLAVWLKVTQKEKRLCRVIYANYMGGGGSQIILFMAKWCWKKISTHFTCIRAPHFLGSKLHYIHTWVDHLLKVKDIKNKMLFLLGTFPFRNNLLLFYWKKPRKLPQSCAAGPMNPSTMLVGFLQNISTTTLSNSGVCRKFSFETFLYSLGGSLKVLGKWPAIFRALKVWKIYNSTEVTIVCEF